MTLKFDQFTSSYDDYSNWNTTNREDIPLPEEDDTDDHDGEQPVRRKKIITKYEDFIFYHNLFKDDPEYGLYGSL